MTVLQKNKKLAAGIGVAAAAAAVLAVGAGTYASFSDIEKVPDTTLAAGTLDLTVGSPVASGPTSLNNLAPGSQVPVTYEVDNVGTVDGRLSVTFTIAGTDAGCAEPEAEIETACSADGASELVDRLQVIYKGKNEGLVKDFVNKPIDLGLLPSTPGPTKIEMIFVVPGGTTGAGNEIMTDTAVITAVARLDQVS